MDTVRFPIGLITLGEALRLYDWHGRHHLTQISNLIERMGW